MAIYMDYPQITTMEHLQTETSSSYGSVLKYEEHVLVTDLTFKGFTAAVYGGSAVLWGFEQIKK